MTRPGIVIQTSRPAVTGTVACGTSGRGGTTAEEAGHPVAENIVP
jgi:hypothetical protein